MPDLLDKIEIIIAKRLLELGMTKKDFIKKIKLTDPGYRYIMEHRSMKVETLLQIASVLKVSIDYFFDDNDIKKIKGKINCERCLANERIIKAQDETIGVYRKALEGLQSAFDQFTNDQRVVKKETA